MVTPRNSAAVQFWASSSNRRTVSLTMCLLSSICSSVSVSGVSHVLLITQRLGRVDLRRLPGGQVGGQERGGVAEDHHEQQRTPRHGVLEAGDILADIIYERARETEAKSHPYTNAE